MNIYRDISALPSFNKAVVTIGSFDGVHLGHHRLIQKIKTIAQRIEGEDIVVTFDPHPRSVIFPNDTQIQLITDLDEKLHLFEKAGVSNVVIVPFTIEFSQQSPREYIEKFIIKSFDPSYLVIGYDHRFGLNRKGDYNLLLEYENKSYFKLEQIRKEELEDIAISSTKIRNYLNEGEVKKAGDFLGYKYCMNGKVVHGEKIGTKIGFPTANIKLPNSLKLVPKTGVYAVEVLHDHFWYKGMLYIGNRPSISRNGKHTIEVNIFDFNKTIYGDSLFIKFICFIREDQKFADLKELKQQLKKDKTTVTSEFLRPEKND